MAGMDALSEALRSVHMTGAIFFHAQCTSPWGIAVPALRQYASLLAPGTERLVAYHLITTGRATVRFDGSGDVPITAGEVVIIPHGHAHVLCNGIAPRILDGTAAIQQLIAGDVARIRIGDGGRGDEPTGIVCGYFGCERHADRLFLSGLPQMIQVPLRSHPAGRWIESSINHLSDPTLLDSPGRAILLAKMAEALFIEAMRRYMAGLPPEQAGWLAAARDPIVGAAIAAMHRSPSSGWTLETLARETASSRSVLSERFARYLGTSPLAYLAMWRFQLAARRLLTSRDSVLRVGLDVGYDSEAAFIRAFKREFGDPPARYRKRQALSAGLASSRVAQRLGNRFDPSGQ